MIYRPWHLFGTGYRYHVSGLLHDYTGFPATSNHQEIERLLTRLHRKIKRQQNELTHYSELFANDGIRLLLLVVLWHDRRQQPLEEGT